MPATFVNFLLLSSTPQLAASLVELYQVVSPLAQQTQELTTAISQHTDFIAAWQEFLKKGAEQREGEDSMESN